MNQFKPSKTVINKLVSSTIVSSLLLTSACTKTDNGSKGNTNSQGDFTTITQLQREPLYSSTHNVN